MEVKSKSDIRKKYKEIRSDLSIEKIDILSQKIANELIRNFNFSNSSVHTFIPIKKLKEVNTLFLLDQLFNTDVTLSTSIYNPKKVTTQHVKIFPYTKYTLGNMDVPIPNSNIPEFINRLDYIIIPLLGYDTHGNRIGYGKGVYDQILSECTKNCKKIGLSFFEPEQQLPFEPHDIKLDFCQTPGYLYDFNYY